MTSFSVASYNVLASSYIDAEWYPHTSPAFLDAGWRIPALANHICAFETDVICLQEVDQPTLAALEASLSRRGYASRYAAKTHGQPDGCATFFREATLALRTVQVVQYSDGDHAGESTGHIALVVVVQHADRLLAIANTHLKWDPPTAYEGHRGLRQIRQLLEERQTISPRCDGWIICGDLNATPSSPIIAALAKAGFSYAHSSDRMARTCNSNSKAKLIDHLFHTAELKATPIGLPRLDDETPLPSLNEPSDHLAIISRFDWIA